MRGQPGSGLAAQMTRGGGNQPVSWLGGTTCPIEHDSLRRDKRRPPSDETFLFSFDDHCKTLLSIQIERCSNIKDSVHDKIGMNGVGFVVAIYNTSLSFFCLGDFLWVASWWNANFWSWGLELTTRLW